MADGSGSLRGGSYSWAWVVLLLVTAGGTGALIAWRLNAVSGAAPAVAPAQAASTPVPQTPPPAPVTEDDLGRAEDLVRDATISSSDVVKRWLAEPGLLRKLAGAVEQVVARQSPRASLGFLAPNGSFSVERTDGRLVMSQRSMARYDDVASAIGTLDVTAVASTMRRIMPVLDATYLEVSGRPGVTFSRALADALTHLVETPVPGSAPAVEPLAQGVGYRFVDDELESLSPAQKHLVRMGPSNQQVVQAVARELLEQLSR